MHKLIEANKTRRIVENIDTDQEKREKLLFQINDIMDNLKNIKQEVKEKQNKILEKIQKKYGSDSILAKTISLKTLYHKSVGSEDTNGKINLGDIVLSDSESEKDNEDQSNRYQLVKPTVSNFRLIEDTKFDDPYYAAAIRTKQENDEYLDYYSKR